MLIAKFRELQEMHLMVCTDWLLLKKFCACFVKIYCMPSVALWVLACFVVLNVNRAYLLFVPLGCVSG